MKRILIGSVILATVIAACSEYQPVNDNVTVNFTDKAPSNATQIAVAGNVVLDNSESNSQ
jgi:hypothetical protein